MPTPPTITVHFDPAAGPLTARVTCGQANTGSYGLTLLGPGAMSIVQQWKADFGSPAQNTHTLGPASQQSGRVLDLIASVGFLDPSKAYAVFLTVSQDGKELGTVSDAGNGSGLTKLVELIVMLSGVSADASIGAGLGLAVTRGATRRGRKVPSRAARRSAVKKRASTAIAAARRMLEAGGSAKQGTKQGTKRSSKSSTKSSTKSRAKSGNARRTRA